MNHSNLLSLRLRTHTIRYNEATDLIGYAIGLVLFFVLFFLIKKFKPNMNDRLVSVIAAIPAAITIVIFITN